MAADHYVYYDGYVKSQDITNLEFAVFDINMKTTHFNNYVLEINSIQTAVFIIATARFVYIYWDNKLIIYDVFQEYPPAEHVFGEHERFDITPIGNVFAVIFIESQTRRICFYTREEKIKTIILNKDNFITAWAGEFYAHVIMSPEFDDADVFVCSMTTRRFEFRAKDRNIPFSGIL